MHFEDATIPPMREIHVGQARSLRARFPELMIVIGLWEFGGGVLKAQERVGSSCVNAVATTLAESLLQIRRLSTASATPLSDESKPGAENGRGGETGPLRSKAAI